MQKILFITLCFYFFSAQAEENKGTVVAEIHFKKDMRCGKSELSYSGPNPDFREPGRLLKGDRYTLLGYDASGKEIIKKQSDLYYLIMVDGVGTISNEGHFEEGKELEGHLSFPLIETQDLKKIKLLDNRKLIVEMDIEPSRRSSIEFGNSLKCYWNAIIKIFGL